MSKPTDNPFRNEPERRNITLTFRVTKAEHDAMVSVAGTKRGAIKDLIREGISLAIDKRRKSR